MTLELSLSIFGAITGFVGMITAIIAVCITLRSHLKDKPILKVSAVLSSSQSTQLPEPHLAFQLTVVNTGHRIARIKAAGIELTPYPGKEIQKNLPAEQKIITFYNNEAERNGFDLAEGQEHQIKSEPFDLNTAKAIGDKGTAFVEDTHGKRHRCEFIVGGLSQFIEQQLNK